MVNKCLFLLLAEGVNMVDDENKDFPKDLPWGNLKPIPVTAILWR